MLYHLEDLKLLEKQVYGLIGFPVKHSMSPFIHTQLKVDCEYILAEINPEQLCEAIPIFKKCFKGFNCTIPFKQAIMPYLDEIDEKARLYGAVNIVKNVGGKLIGYNTDGDGFCFALKNANISLENKNVLIIGAGGVSRVMAYEALKHNATVFIYSRTFSKTKKICEELGKNVFPVEDVKTQKYDIIINGSPVGMWDKISFMPIEKDVIKASQAVFDSIYNPINTKLVMCARENGVLAEGGLLMLIGQAISAQKIWFGSSPDGNANDIFNKTAKKLNEDFKYNIILSGFMGSGKSTIGKEMAEKLSREFIDLDSFIEAKGQTIKEIFETKGEEGFRKIEESCLKEVLAQHRGAIIALGGGVLTRIKNIENIKNSVSFLVFLNASKEKILERVGSGEGRPLLEKENLICKVNELYAKRIDTYLQTADITVNADGDIEYLAQEIINKLGLVEE